MLGNTVKSKRKNDLATATLFIMVFAIMLVALMYNPQGTSDNDIVMDDRNPVLVTVYGIVTNGNGTPLEDARIWSQSAYGDFYATVYANGSYTLEFNTTTSTSTIIASCDGHWTELATIHPKWNNTEFNENFTLLPSTVVCLPLGIVAFIDSSDGLSNFSMNVNLTHSYYQLRQDGSNETPCIHFSSKNLTCNVSVGNGPTLLYADVSIVGTYIKGNGTITVMFCDVLGDIYGVPLNVEEPDIFSGSWSHSTYNLVKGEQANITLATKNATYQFPLDDQPAFFMGFLGETITFQEVNFSTQDIDGETGEPIDSSVSAVSVNIVPMAGGNHLYDVFTKDGCMIYIQEVTGTNIFGGHNSADRAL